MFKPSFWKNADFKLTVYSSELRSDLKEFCQKAEKEKKKPASTNMNFKAILTLLEKDDRFKEGEFLLFYLNKKIVAVSGYHQLPSDSRTFVCGVRTYTLGEFEHHGIHSNFLLPYQFEKVFSATENQALLVFNEYNEKIFRFIESLLKLVKRQSGRDLKSHSFPQKIKYKNTVQYAVLVYHNELRTKPIEDLIV